METQREEEEGGGKKGKGGAGRVAKHRDERNGWARGRLRAIGGRGHRTPKEREFWLKSDF